MGAPKRQKVRKKGKWGKNRKDSEILVGINKYKHLPSMFYAM